jgi:hypothetical protein
MDTQMRQWIKEQIVAINNKELDEDKTKMFLEMIEKAEGTDAYAEIATILSECKIEQLRRKAITHLLKAIAVERRSGYGAICYDLPKYVSKNSILRQSVIDYVKERYKKVEVFAEDNIETGRKAFHNINGLYVGDMLVIEWK